jgi:aerobic C4-dicarboxylate transport protein
MKIWLKILIGLALGLAVGLIVPLDAQAFTRVVAFIATLTLRIGRALIVPLFFFSAVLGVYQLHEDKQILKTLLIALGLALAFTAGLTFFGIVSVLAINPTRIPIPAESVDSGVAFKITDFFLKLFPDGMFDIFHMSGFLLPAFLLCIILGIVLSAERANAKPAVMLFDSLSRVSYHLNNYFSEFLAFGAIFLCADGIFQLRAVADPSRYRGLIALILADSLITALVILPAVLYFSCGRKNPYRYLYALLAPSLTAFFSGDVNFSLGILNKHAKESLGIRRRANSLSTAAGVLVGRAGSSMVAAVTFIIIIKSYSSLGISPLQILWVLCATMVVSLVLSSAPGTGSITAVILLCSLFGRGFESGYQIVRPIAWPLIASGAFIDILVSGASSLIGAKLMGMQEDKESRFFI